MVIKIKKEDRLLLEAVVTGYHKLMDAAYDLTGRGRDDEECFIPRQYDLYYFKIQADKFACIVDTLEHDKFSFHHGGILLHNEFAYLELVKCIARDLAFELSQVPLYDTKLLKFAVEKASWHYIFQNDTHFEIEQIVKSGLKRFKEAFPDEFGDESIDDRVVKLRKGDEYGEDE